MRKFMVTIEGKQYEVEVEEIGADNATPIVKTVKTAAPAAVKAPVATAPAAAPVASANVEGEKLESPMPGMIKSLAKKDGDTVAKDEPILVLEAMKMDNDITAPCAGKVYYKVAPGQSVDTAALLAVISK